VKRLTAKDRLIFVCIMIIATACVGSALYIITGAYAVTVQLSDYTSLGRNADGVPTAVLDVDAILTDLCLPNPRYGHIRAEDYPDVNALCNLRLSMVYDTAGEEITLNVTGDLRTLLRYGIRLHPVIWTQSLRGIIAEDSSQAAPMTTPEPPGESISFPTQTAGSVSRMDMGYLQSPVDLDGYGINLRPVLERAQVERDNAARDWQEDGVETRKLRACFVRDRDATAFHNLYRAVYYIRNTKTGGERWITVDIYDLEWTEQSAVAYAAVLTQSHRTEVQALSRSAFTGSAFSVYELDGSSVSNGKRLPFDHNGLVRFPGMPASYRMPNGQIWSPSFDKLPEDRIWQLTGTGGHSMANLLRYVRKEIGARTGQPFDPESEAEFFAHFSARSWYMPVLNWTEDYLSAEQRENIELLLEIQELISN